MEKTSRVFIRASYFLILLLQLIILPRYSMASCNALVSHADQIFCHNTVSQHGITDVELWRRNQNPMFATELLSEKSKLVVLERKESGNGQEITRFNDIPAGKLFLQDIDEHPEAPDLKEGTLIRLKRQGDRNRTLMLVLSPRSESDEFFGSDFNRTITQDGSGLDPKAYDFDFDFDSGSSSETDTKENSPEASGINPVHIIVPVSIFVSLQLYGWYGALTHLHDVYFYDRVNNGARAEKLSYITVVTTAFCTFGLSLIPHYIMYRIRHLRGNANPA